MTNQTRQSLAGIALAVFGFCGYVLGWTTRAPVDNNVITWLGRIMWFILVSVSFVIVMVAADRGNTDA